MVFRGFVDDALQIVTDGRSDKVEHIQACPWAEACWYFTVTREQFRIAGKLALIRPEDSSDIRLNAWQAMSANARQQFYWPHPGQSRADADAFEAVVHPAEQPPDSFYVLLLTAERVDYLNLKGNPQDRQIYRYSQDSWSVEAVNP